MRIGPFTSASLPELVRYWNREFRAKRNFVRMTPALFRERVCGRSGFRASRFLIAREGGRIVGFVHAGTRRGEGAVHFLHVTPRSRRRGVGSGLWHEARERLGRVRVIVVDGPETNPFYGSPKGPVAPLWGTPRGVAVEWNDAATRKFLARKGYIHRWRGVQMAAGVRRADRGRAGVSVRSTGWVLRRGGASLHVFRMGREAFGLHGLTRGGVALVGEARALAAREGGGRCEALVPEGGELLDRLRSDGFRRVAEWAMF